MKANQLKRTCQRALGTALILALALSLLPGSTFAAANTTYLVSWRADASANYYFADNAYYPSLSRLQQNILGNTKVVFTSPTAIAPEDANGTYDVYWNFFDEFEHTPPAHTSYVVSYADLNGTSANGASSFGVLLRDRVPSIDGSFIVFQSRATNLYGANRTSTFIDIFLYQRADNRLPITQVSIFDNGSGGAVEGNNHSGNTQAIDNSNHLPAAIYRRGQTINVVFQSDASSQAGDTNGKRDLFVRSDAARVDGSTPAPATTLLTRGYDVATQTYSRPANDDSWAPTVSEDGRYVAFISKATNLLQDMVTTRQNIFLMDRDADNDSVYDEFLEQGAIKVSLVSHYKDDPLKEAVNPTKTYTPFFPAISADGKYVSFSAQPVALGFGNTGEEAAVFVYDRDSGSVTHISAGIPNNQQATSSSISDDGRFVAFTAFADHKNDLCDYRFEFGSQTVCPDIYIKDRQSADPPALLSYGRDNQVSNYASTLPSISGDGRYVGFQSSMSNPYNGPNALVNSPTSWNIYTRELADPAAQPNLKVFPTQWNFGKAQANQEFTVYNISTLPSTLNLGDLTSANAGLPACFEFSDGTCNSAALERSAGSPEIDPSCKFYVAYRGDLPECQVGVHSASLVIPSDDPDTPTTTVRLQGGEGSGALIYLPTLFKYYH